MLKNILTSLCIANSELIGGGRGAGACPPPTFNLLPLLMELQTP